MESTGTETEHGVADIEVEGSSWRGKFAKTLLGSAGSERLRAAFDDADFLKYRYVDRAGRANQRALQGFFDVHRDETCVIIGNGPSLRRTDLSLLQGVPTFGLNRIYLMFEELGFATTYHVVVNRLVVEQYAAEIEDLSVPRFTTRPNASAFSDGRTPNLLQPLHGLGFSPNITHGVWEGATVTYVAMQLAYYMGFRKVVLVGVDHSFGVSGPAHKVVETVQNDSSHFHPNYFGKGIKWQLPDLETSEAAYRLAGETYRANGREIVDATVGGALDIFPKVGLAEALH